MSKFKIGDKVRVTNSESLYTGKGAVGVVSIAEDSISRVQFEDEGWLVDNRRLLATGAEEAITEAILSVKMDYDDEMGYDDDEGELDDDEDCLSCGS